MNASVPRELIVGLDVGTTGVKAVAFALGSSWRQTAIREYALLQPAPNQEVQDPAVVLAAAADALAECAATSAGGKVLAISVSAAMHGLIGLDDQVKPLTPLITWADARARDQARALRQSGRAAGIQALTGTPVHPMSPLIKLMWFAQHDRQTFETARWWVGLKEYVLFWLTGQLVTELSSASGTGLLDMSTGHWSSVARELCGIRAEQLPRILPTTSMLALAPATALRVGLPPGTPVVVGAGDGPLGNLGAGAMAPGVAGLSLGTSGAIRMAVRKPQVDGGGALFCYSLTDGWWVVGGAISNGGGVVRWVGRSLAPDVAGTAGGGADHAVLELAAGVPAGSDGLVMLPYLLAERAPLWDPDLPGAYLGLRGHHTRAHLARAAIEGVCLQMRIILDRLDAVEPVTEVRATGGVFRSTLWREVMAGMLGRPVHVVNAAEGTALGAAALAVFALGRTPTLTQAVAQFTDPSQTVPPEVVSPAPELVNTYERLRRAVPRFVAELDEVATLFKAYEEFRVDSSNMVV